MKKKECQHKEWNPCGNNFYSCRECGILRTIDQVNIYSEKDKKIAELETKLAEKDVELEKWSTQYARAYVNRQNDLIAKNAELKQQLEDKDREIEDIRSTHIYRFYLDKDKVQDVYITDLMLKVFNQDKISFCIEKLEKLRNEITPIFCVPGGIYSNLHNEVFKTINNQIEQLKEIK